MLHVTFGKSPICGVSINSGKGRNPVRRRMSVSDRRQSPATPLSAELPDRQHLAQGKFFSYFFHPSDCCRDRVDRDGREVRNTQLIITSPLSPPQNPLNQTIFFISLRPKHNIPTLSTNRNGDTHNTKRYRNTNLKENIYPYKKKT